MEYRRDIDGLRAVAVGAVVASHAGLPGFAGGFVGVDVFFVISGYLITAILLDEHRAGTYSILRFYERRARRILPALVAMLAFCLVAGWFLVPPPQYERLGASTVATAMFVSNMWFMARTGGYFDAAAEYNLLLHTWSLAVEEQFYIVWPLLLAIRLGRRRLALMLVVLTLASFIHATSLTFSAPKQAFFLVTSRAWELGVGALLAIVPMPVVRRLWLVEFAAWAAVAMLATPILWYDAGTPFPGLAAVPPVLATAVLIGIGNHHSTFVSKFLASKIAVGIGLISYSLYLWHWPLLALARLHVGSLAIGPRYAAAAVGLSVVLAWLSWRYIERPFRAGGRRTGREHRWTIAFAVPGIVALGALGAIVASSEGFWSRAADLRHPYQRAVTRSAQELACWKIAPEKRCRVGHPTFGRPTVLLWGDSHAAAMIPGLDSWLRKGGIDGEVAILQTCAPLLGVERDGGTDGKCIAFNRKTLDHVLRSPTLQEVYLVGRWPLTVTGQRPEGEDGGPVILRTAAGGGDIADNAALVEQGLGRLLAELKGTNKRVYLLSDVPELGRGPAQRMLSARFYGHPYDRGPTLLEVERRQREANRILRRLASRHGATFVDVAAIICGGRCPVVQDGEVLYRDENHLSRFGATTLIPLILDRVAAETSGRTETEVADR